MKKWILPTLSEVLSLSELTSKDCPSLEVGTTRDCGGDVGTSPLHSINQSAVRRIQAEREWWVAIAALEQMLIHINSAQPSEVVNGDSPLQGLIFAGPVPVLSHKARSSLQNWIFTADLKSSSGAQFQLPPAAAKPSEQILSSTTVDFNLGSVLPLLPGDPLCDQQFCLVLTAGFSLVMVLGEDLTGTPTFLFSFEPEVVEQAWQALRARVVLSFPHFPLKQLDALVEQYYPVAPKYQTVTQFSRLLLKHLPEAEAARGWGQGSNAELPRPSRPDVELLQAFAHEVRTPLTTIRTLTRLLLKRKDLASDVLKRLEIIDHECTEQIDRMELLFRAAELETSMVKHTGAHLTAMSLTQVLQQSVPRWQKQASRRNLTLDVVLPQQLPTVVSDPIMLDQVLTGLIENFTRSLPAGSHIQVQVIPAGDQLKLQLLPQPQSEESGEAAEPETVLPTRKSLGPLLMFQPETGNISLNLAATKHLFQAIGGKLIVRQRLHQGEVLTIFLPLELRGVS